MVKTEKFQQQGGQRSHRPHGGYSVEDHEGLLRARRRSDQQETTQGAPTAGVQLPGRGVAL